MWDKLNKSNYYLELSIESADLPLDDRLIAYLNKELISDGGQWDMAVNLLEVGSLFSFVALDGLSSSNRPMVLYHNPYTRSPSRRRLQAASTASSSSNFANIHLFSVNWSSHCGQPRTYLMRRSCSLFVRRRRS